MKKIAITSGKGGTGKTSVSVNLAIAMAEAGQRVVLFDADLQLANVDVAMGIKPECNLQHVVSGQKTLRESLAIGPSGVRVASGGSAIGSLMTAGPKKLGLFFDQIDELAEDTDVILFDTSAGLDNRVMAFARKADQTVIVTTPDPTSVTDGYATLKTLWKKEPEAHVTVLVNMAVTDEEGVAVFNTIHTISKAFLTRVPAYLGALKVDPRMVMSVRRRKPLMIMSPASQAADDIRKAAAKLLGGPPASLRIAA